MKFSPKPNNTTRELSNKKKLIIKLIGLYEIAIGLWVAKYFLDLTYASAISKVSIVFFISLILFSIISGVLLFLQKNLGYIFSLMLQISQIFSIVISGLTYSFLFGPELTLLFSSDSNIPFNILLTFDPHVALNGLIVNTSPHAIEGWKFEINLIAMMLAVVLLQATKSFSSIKLNYAARKTIAFFEILTGVFGLSMFFDPNGFNPGNTSMILTAATYIIIFTLSICAGVLLWRDKVVGYKLSILIQAFQVIGIDLSSFTFILLPYPSIYQSISNQGTSLYFKFSGTSLWFNFFFETVKIDPTLFINYLSLAFLLVIVYQYRSKHIN